MNNNNNTINLNLKLCDTKLFKVANIEKTRYFNTALQLREAYGSTWTTMEGSMRVDVAERKELFRKMGSLLATKFQMVFKR